MRTEIALLFPLHWTAIGRALQAEWTLQGLDAEYERAVALYRPLLPIHAWVNPCLDRNPFVPTFAVAMLGSCLGVPAAFTIPAMMAVFILSYPIGIWLDKLQATVCQGYYPSVAPTFTLARKVLDLHPATRHLYAAEDS